MMRLRQPGTCWNWMRVAVCVGRQHVPRCLGGYLQRLRTVVPVLRGCAVRHVGEY